MAHPARNEKALNVLLLAAAAAVAIAYVVPRYVGAVSPALSSMTAAQAAPAQASIILAQAATAPSAPQAKIAAPTLPAPIWVAAGQGRVEPYGGEVRITAQAQGRIVEVLAALNDKVQAGELLVRLDDSDPEARVAAAEAEASVRRRERNGETVTGVARERRNAEDTIATTERLVAATRAEYDRQVRLRRAGKAADVTKAHDAVVAARDQLDTNRANLRRIVTGSNVPEHTRFEASIAAARSDISLAEAALERTRIRAPKDGTILQVIATAGETAVPSPDQVMIIIGDMSKLRVRAELEERDSAKVRLGQSVVVRSDAFPGKDFDGKVAQIAQALAPSKIGLKGPRRGLEVDVLEVLVDLDNLPALLPGMRVDVLLKPDTTAEAPKDAPKQN
jgi:HlyD family secretion protein